MKEQKPKYKIDLLGVEDLTNEMKKEFSLSDEFSPSKMEKDDLFLVIYRNGELYELYRERYNPEDVKFGKGLYWVPMELERAYELGYKDGQQDLARQVFGDKVFKFLEGAGDVLKGLAKWRPKIVIDRKTIDRALEERKMTKRRKIVKEEDLYPSRKIRPTRQLEVVNQDMVKTEAMPDENSKGFDGNIEKDSAGHGNPDEK